MPRFRTAKILIALLVAIALLLGTFSFAFAAGSSALGARKLSVGMSGQDVKELQTILKSKGYFNYQVTGYFGPVTKKAVMDYQRASKLYPYGVADFTTIKSLKAAKSASAALTPWVAPKGLEGDIILATTTSTQDSGLLDVLVPAFEKKAGIKVKVVAVGTGQAIQLGKDGNADVLLVHARKDEDAFVAGGYGSNAWDVMYNQFLIVGPAKDPAGIKGMTDAVKAFKQIAAKKARFVSRGDNSGTHKKEQSLWATAGIDPQGKDWYISAGQGMGETLKMADELGTYTLTDEATFLTSKNLDLTVLVKGDSKLFNPYGVIKVNSTKKPKAADAFISFITSKEGQKMIGDFQKSKYGRSIFIPNAKKR